MEVGPSQHETGKSKCRDIYLPHPTPSLESPERCTQLSPPVNIRGHHPLYFSSLSPAALPLLSIKKYMLLASIMMLAMTHSIRDTLSSMSFPSPSPRPHPYLWRPTNTGAPITCPDFTASVLGAWAVGSEPVSIGGCVPLRAEADAGLGANAS